MKITMFSNAMSHHQKPFCDYMAQTEGVEFYFVASKKLTDERKNMGYADLNHASPYIIRSYENDGEWQKAMDLARDSDFVIYGSAPYAFIRERLKKNKWTFLYSERLFKREKDILFSMKIGLYYMLRFGIHVRKKTKVLCASAYAAKDFHKLGFHQGQLYKWGYFPKLNENSVPFEEKEKNSIVWVGRFIDWKHPEVPVALAAALKEKGISFHLTMIGNGELFSRIQNQVHQAGLEDCLTLTGALPADEVRTVMERAEVFVASSDQNEGWGAVINEGMSGGCAVCASKEMGAAPFLIQDGVNGFLYHYADGTALASRVEELLSNPEERKMVAQNAVSTMKTEWNAENAANKIVELCRKLETGSDSFAFADGVGSIAEIDIKI